MKVEQLSVFLENKTGRLAEVTQALAAAGVNIRALSLADTSDFGILRFIADNTEKARATLKEAGFTVGRTQVVALRVEDTAGGLDHVLQCLKGEGVNVEYMYAFVQRDTCSATLIFRFDDIDRAVETLQARNIPILTAAELAAC